MNRKYKTIAIGVAFIVATALLALIGISVINGLSGVSQEPEIIETVVSEDVSVDIPVIEADSNEPNEKTTEIEAETETETETEVEDVEIPVITDDGYYANASEKVIEVEVEAKEIFAPTSEEVANGDTTVETPVIEKPPVVEKPPVAEKPPVTTAPPAQSQPPVNSGSGAPPPPPGSTTGSVGNGTPAGQGEFRPGDSALQ